MTISPDDPRFMAELDRRYTALLPSAPISSPEQYNRLSDIVHTGTGTCAAKTQLLGVLLSRRYPGLQLQEIYGQVGRVRDRVSYPFGHAWLRIESSRYIFLYDAMYSRIACFEKQGDKIVPTDNAYQTFENYSVEAFPMTSLMNAVKASSVSGIIKIANSHDATRRQAFLNADAGLQAQGEGSIHFQFEIRQPVHIELIDGHLQTKAADDVALYYPL